MVEKKKEKKVKTENKQKKVKTEKTVKEEKTGKVEKKIAEEKKQVLKRKPGKKAEVKKTKIPVPRKEEKKVYRVTGSFLMGSRYQTFTKEVMTSDPKEKIYSDFGSSHKVKRRNIKIDDVKELKNDEITDSLLKQLAKGE